MSPFEWLSTLKCNSLHLTRDDDHACNYMTAEAWILQHPENFYDIPPNDIAAMMTTNTIWHLQIYPDTPIGSYSWYGPTAEYVIREAMESDAHFTQQGGVS